MLEKSKVAVANQKPALLCIELTALFFKAGNHQLLKKVKSM